MEKIASWVSTYFDRAPVSLVPLPGDASFKMFYRLNHESKSYLVMSAPPHQEKVTAFFQVAQSLLQRGVRVPNIYAVDLAQGFFLMEDFGESLYYDVLTEQNRSILYRRALATLLNVQSGHTPHVGYFDEAAIQAECALFTEWCFQLLEIKANTAEVAMLSQVFEQLVDTFSAQPQVLVHRDYHSRNLFVLPEGDETPGVIDFQDAVIGPLTYDVVSLLKDCYLSWPFEALKPLLEDFYLSLRADKQSGMQKVSFDTFVRWFDWTGLRRHIKVLGIFARLHLRDHKSRYLFEMPRVFAYVLSVTENYPEWRAFHAFVRGRVLPAFSQYWQKEHIPVLATNRDKGLYHELLVSA